MSIKKFVSLFLAITFMLNMFSALPIEAFAVTEDSHVYEKDGYTVTYKIGSEWDNNRSVEVTLKNTGKESILNWALKYDVGGEVYSLWNSMVYSNDEDGTVIKNNGYNYEIEPGQSANYGYIVTGAETLVPEDIELCSRRIDVKSGYEVDFNITNDWYTGFQAEVSIKNTSSEPIEAWTLLFEGNFDIVDIWNSKLLSNENRSYEVANQLWTTPIQAGESASFGFTADKSATENAEISNYQLTAVIVGESVFEKEPADPNNPEDDIDYELDTDKDGLPDYYEEILGTDKNKADTDGDGLSDYYEVFYLGTDPLKADSDDNGVNDGNEDNDKDGLTNAKEQELGTDPNNDDTDSDGLSDSAEANTHGTDPLKFDTDDDGIPDGDEITLRLNPNSSTTNGTLDSERSFVQTVDAESEVLSAINDDENVPFEVSLEIKAAGVAENNVYARESGYSNAIENSAIIGVAPEFVYTDGLSVEEVTVKFKLDNSVINNSLGTYAENNDGFKGIKRLNIFMFIEDVNMLLPIETNYDEVNNVVYTTTDRVGTYCLMDMEIFFQNLGIEPTESAEVEVSEAMSGNKIDNEGYLCYNVSENIAKTSNPDNDEYMGSVHPYKDDFDVVFIIDRVNYDNLVLNVYSNRILETAKTIWNISPNVNITVYTINGDGITHYEKYDSLRSEKELKNVLDKIKKNPNPIQLTTNDGTVTKEVYLSNAIDDIINHYDSSSKGKQIYCFAFFDANNNKYRHKYDSKSRLYGIKQLSKKINISVCSNIASNLNNETDYAKMTYAVALCKMTNGVEISRNNFKDDILMYIYGEIPSVKYQYRAIIATGYQFVDLKSPLTKQDRDNAYRLIHDIGETSNYVFDEYDLDGCSDTDEDGLWDFEEVMFFLHGKSIIDINDYDELIFPTVAEILGETDEGKATYFKTFNKKAYIEKGKEKAREQYKDSWEEFMTWSILPIKSDPTNPDGDLDGMEDDKDRTPLSDNVLFSQIQYNEKNLNINKVIFQYYQKLSVDFSWFYKNPQKYNNDLALASSIMSGLAYHTSDILNDKISDRISKPKYEYSYMIENADKTFSSISEVMNEFDFKEPTTVNLRNKYSDNHLIQFDIGYKDISKYSNGSTEKNLLAIFVRGTHGTEEWYSNFDIGDTDSWVKGTDWHTKENHKGFDTAAYRAFNEINAYINDVQKNLNPKNTVVWLTGHSRGAAVSGIIATYLIEEGYTVYGYNFATPNQVETNLIDNNISNTSYKTIFNIINEDDLVPYLPLSFWGFSKYGTTPISTTLTKKGENLWKTRGIHSAFLDFDIGATYDKDSILLYETIAAFNDLAKDRNDCYKEDDNEDKYVFLPSSLSLILFKEANNLKEFMCDYTIVMDDFSGESYKKMHQKPVLFMQILAGVAAGDSSYNSIRFMFGDYSADYYDLAANKMSMFSISSGMMNPHYVDAYIIICEEEN